MPQVNNSGVYQIEHTASGKKYIGSSIDLKTRLSEHRTRLRSGRHVNKELQNAWVKYTEPAFTFKVLELVGDTSALIEREQYWIDHFQAATRAGFNIVPRAGSCLGRIMTAEHKAKISAANTGKKRDEAAKAKIRAARALQTITPESLAKTHAANFGKKRSDEARKNISEGRRGMKFSPEHIANIVKARTGTAMPEETKAKIAAGVRAARAKRKGEDNHEH